ncbi:MAG: DUF373 family protein [Archaeoglobaceae archaeon]
MEKLVVVIDRDNDLGEKAGISSPVVGKKNVIEAAVRLATVDPEDSDVNAMFAGVKLAEELGCDVVVVCGDKSVGAKSDTRVATQLDEIARVLKPESVVVVTDGSEDEFVMPLIYSRFKVDSVHRVVVKQSRTIESTYFMIRRMLNDPKVARVTLAPLGVIFLVYSISLLLQHPEWGLGGIVFFLGIYFLAKAYGWDKSVEAYGAAIKNSLVEGRISFVLYITSAILLVVGVVQGINAAMNVEDYRMATSFVTSSIGWFALAGIFAALARAADAYAEGRGIAKYFSTSFLIASGALLIWGAARFIETPNIVELATSLIAGIIVAAIGVYSFRRR